MLTVLDVRELPKPARHPAIFEQFRKLAVGESFVLINDHDPVHLRHDFDARLSGSFDWAYIRKVPRDWQVEITKVASTAVPRVLTNTAHTDTSGVAYSIDVPERDLDLNVISLAADRSIELHTGPSVDVIVHVAGGAGVVATEVGVVPVTVGDVVFLPRGSQRGFRAGPDGLRYLTVHRKREPLPLGDGMMSARELGS